MEETPFFTYPPDTDNEQDGSSEPDPPDDSQNDPEDDDPQNNDPQDNGQQNGDRQQQGQPKVGPHKKVLLPEPDPSPINITTPLPDFSVSDNDTLPIALINQSATSFAHTTTPSDLHTTDSRTTSSTTTDVLQISEQTTSAVTESTDDKPQLTGQCGLLIHPIIYVLIVDIV